MTELITCCRTHVSATAGQQPGRLLRRRVLTRGAAGILAFRGDFYFVKDAWLPRFKRPTRVTPGRPLI
jgi:hypothetical protein